jgi:hypothetical protein
MLTGVSHVIAVRCEKMPRATVETADHSADAEGIDAIATRAGGSHLVVRGCRVRFGPISNHDWRDRSDGA